MKPIDMPQGFQMFECEQPSFHSPVIGHLGRAGRALAVLWGQYKGWEHTIPLISRMPIMKRAHLKSKTIALVRHDRILRGEV